MTSLRSTLLRAIGAGLVVGFPSNLHALYVDQLVSTSAECSVMELVMDADKAVVLWRQQADLLQVWAQLGGVVTLIPPVDGRPTALQPESQSFKYLKPVEAVL